MNASIKSDTATGARACADGGLMSDNDRKVLLDFIDELKKNYLSVAWNSGLDTVIFVDKSVDGYKSLNQMIKEYLNE